MATTVYEWDIADYGTTGWNAIYKAFTESVDSLLKTYLKVTLGEDVSKGDALYIQANEKWYKALADDTQGPAQGFAIEDGVADASIRIQRCGELTVAGWATLSVGRGVWLSTGTKGGITQTKPASHAQFLGIALTSTSININIAIDDGPSLPMSTTTTTTTTMTTTTSSTTTTTTTSP